jgi:hypothetical protein
MNVLEKDYKSLKNSVHYTRFMALLNNHKLTIDQLIAVHSLINNMNGYGSFANANRAYKVLEFVIAAHQGNLTIDYRKES